MLSIKHESKLVTAPLPATVGALQLSVREKLGLQGGALRLLCGGHFLSDPEEALPSSRVTAGSCVFVKWTPPLEGHVSQLEEFKALAARMLAAPPAAVRAKVGVQQFEVLGPEDTRGASVRSALSVVDGAVKAALELSPPMGPKPTRPTPAGIIFGSDGQHTVMALVPPRDEASSNLKIHVLSCEGGAADAYDRNCEILAAFPYQPKVGYPIDMDAPGLSEDAIALAACMRPAIRYSLALHQQTMCKNDPAFAAAAIAAAAAPPRVCLRLRTALPTGPAPSPDLPSTLVFEDDLGVIVHAFVDESGAPAATLHKPAEHWLWEPGAPPTRALLEQLAARAGLHVVHTDALPRTPNEWEALRYAAPALHHLHVQAEGAERRAAAGAGAALEEPGEPLVGEAVAVHGLASEKGKALNGAIGIVMRWVPSKGRYDVQLAQPELGPMARTTVSLKAANLRVKPDVIIKHATIDDVSFVSSDQIKAELQGKSMLELCEELEGCTAFRLGPQHAVEVLGLLRTEVLGAAVGLQQLRDAAAAERVAVAMEAFPREYDVQLFGAEALGMMASKEGTEDYVMGARALPLLVRTMDLVSAPDDGETNRASSNLSGDACGLIASVSNICFGSDKAGLARKAEGCRCGAIEATVRLMRACPGEERTQDEGLRLFAAMIVGPDIYGNDEPARERRKRLVASGALAEAVAALWRYPQLLQSHGERFISIMCVCPPLLLGAIRLGFEVPWLNAVPQWNRENALRILAEAMAGMH